MKRAFLLLSLGLLGLTLSSTAHAQRVAISVNAGTRCGPVYAGPGYTVGPVSAGAIYRPSPVVCYPVAPAVYYPTPYYSGYTTGTTVVYSSGYGTNVSPVAVTNVGAPVVLSGNILANPNSEPRKLQLRTSR